MGTTQPVLQAGQNQYGEDDPRQVDQGNAPVSYNTHLTDMADEIRAVRRGLPTTHEINDTGASLEALLTELWTEAYKNHIEPSHAMPLGQMSAKRREKVEKWRKIFLEKKLVMFRQAINARTEIIVYVQDIWSDILAIQQG
jgi:hypothetical protein